MKKWNLIILLLFSIRLFAQECEISQKILDNYTVDASFLTLQEIYSDSLHEYFDSAKLSPDLLEKYKGILSSVYLMESDLTDSIFNLLKIHVFPDIPYMEIGLNLDTNYSWVKKYINDSLISGNARFDSIMLEYNFRMESSYSFKSVTAIRIKTNEILNLKPIVNSLKQIAGITSVEEISSWVGDGDNIKTFYRNDTVYVEFSTGWGDCPSGCINKHYWKYAVSNCNSTFISSYGDYFTSIKSNSLQEFKVYPNPVIDYLTIDSEFEIAEMNIYSFTGQKIYSERNISSKIDLSFLKPDLYILELKNGAESIRVKLLKK